MSYRAYLALKNHGILPHDYIALSQEEQAFLAACDLTEVDEINEVVKRRKKRRR